MWTIQVRILLEFDAHRTANVLPVLSRKPYHQHYLSLGLGFFHTVLRASREDKLRILQDNMGYSFWSLSRALEEGPEWDSPMYDAYRNRATIVFDGDDRTDCPNAAWIWSTKTRLKSAMTSMRRRV